MGFWVWVEDKISEGSKNALMLIAPWVLLMLSIVFFVTCGINFHSGAEQNRQIKLNAVVEDIIDNPGDRYYEWGALWGVQATSWDELEDDFAPVQEDWANRGLKLDWEFMTARYKEFTKSQVTFPEYSDWLFKRIRDKYVNDNVGTGTPKDTIAAIVLLVFGIITFLIAAVWIKIMFFG